VIRFLFSPKGEEGKISITLLESQFTRFFPSASGGLGVDGLIFVLTNGVTLVYTYLFILSPQQTLRNWRCIHGYQMPKIFYSCSGNKKYHRRREAASHVAASFKLSNKAP
jgi:hypothetical protein